MNVNTIKAFHQSEEQYEGLKLEYIGQPELRGSVLKAYKSVVTSTGLTPVIHENGSIHDSESMYIEFYDDVKKEGGAFIADMLNHLGIKEAQVA